MTLVIGYVLAALIGLSLGLMGGGGSILTVPVFVYVLGYDPKLAIVMSFPVVGVTSFVGALSNWRAGNIDLRMAALFGAVTITGAFAGARLARYLPGAVQMSILAVIILVAAASMFRSARRPPTVQSVDERNKTTALLLLLSVALLVGVTTGVVGIGGGFLVVPALVLLARVPMKQAVGTSLLVIAMNCASGLIGSPERGLVPWEFVTGFAAVAVGGILVGTYLGRYVSQRTLKQAFAVFLLAIGTFILIKNRRVFSHPSVALNLLEQQRTPA